MLLVELAFHFTRLYLTILSLGAAFGGGGSFSSESPAHRLRRRATADQSRFGADPAAAPIPRGSAPTRADEGHPN